MAGIQSLDNLDRVLAAEWAGDTTGNARAIAQDFEDWLAAQRDEIEAAMADLRKLRDDTVELLDRMPPDDEAAAN